MPNCLSEGINSKLLRPNWLGKFELDVTPSILLRVEGLWSLIVRNFDLNVCVNASVCKNEENLLLGSLK
jgi:hypothetical protein